MLYSFALFGLPNSAKKGSPRGAVCLDGFGRSKQPFAQPVVTLFCAVNRDRDGIAVVQPEQEASVPPDKAGANLSGICGHL